ncbi:MAG: hypothetical protein SAJ72_15100, partial [Jaaginema sp. PMC 1080.18]|nr:hypothetical protein [Jaaginema sp. PMC 1080.18]
MNTIKKITPWQIKVISKILLSRLPVSYKKWKFLSLFNHGYMNNFDYAYNIFRIHFLEHKVPKNFTTLELGPGDSLLSVMVNYALGGKSCYLVDTGNYAITDIM